MPVPVKTGIEIISQRDAATVAACLERFLAAFPHPVHTILTGANVYRERQALTHGAELTDRFGAARWQKKRRATGSHCFDQVCTRHRSN